MSSATGGRGPDDDREAPRRTAGDPTILFVGTGQAARLHARLLARDHPGVGRVYWGRAAGAAASFAAELGGVEAQGSLGDAIAREGIDAVFVTTPPDTHRDVAVEALRTGRDVLVEKPAFLSAAEFDDVEAAASAAGRQVLVTENYYYKPLLRRIVALLASGELGQIRLLSFNAAKLQPVEGWRADPAQAGGGALFEGGIHWVSFMASLGLTIRTVEGWFPDAPAGHERSAVFVAEYEQGAVGVLTYSWEIPSTFRGLRLSRIYGTRSSLLFESNGLFLLRGGSRPRIWFPGLSDIQGYRAMLEDFMRALRTGERPDFTLAHARRDVELVLRAYTQSTDRDSQRKEHP